MSTLPASDSLLGLRKSALALHSMAAPDRAWVMAQLPASQKNQLDLLMKELVSMGFPAAQKLIADVLKANEVPIQSTTQPLASWSELASFPPRVWHQVLSQEPDELIAQVTSRLPRSLQQSIAELASHSRASRLLGGQGATTADQVALPAQRDQCLREALHLQLQQASLSLRSESAGVPAQVKRSGFIKTLSSLVARSPRALKS